MASYLVDFASSLDGEAKLVIKEFCQEYQKLRSTNAIDREEAIFATRFVAGLAEQCAFYVPKRMINLRDRLSSADSVVGYVLENYDNLIAKDMHVVADDMLARFQTKNRETFGIANLNSDEKVKLHAAIARIRLIIEESALSDNKKNALYERLNALSKEVDLSGTKTDRFFAFMGDAAFVIGDMTEKAKPFIDEVKELVKIISRSRSRQEGVSLPPGDEALMLPPPSL